MTGDPKLLDILACPECRTPVEIPVMLIDEAKVEDQAQQGLAHSTQAAVASA